MIKVVLGKFVVVNVPKDKLAGSGTQAKPRNTSRDYNVVDDLIKNRSNLLSDESD